MEKHCKLLENAEVLEHAKQVVIRYRKIHKYRLEAEQGAKQNMVTGNYLLWPRMCPLSEGRAVADRYLKNTLEKLYWI